MFEAFVTLCALGADAPCREVLLPGHAAETRAGCEADLAGAAGVLAAGRLPHDPTGRRVPWPLV